jgi:hypothetical protein
VRIRARFESADLVHGETIALSCLYWGCVMRTDPEYRKLIAKLIAVNPGTVRPKMRFQESWDTLVPGLASMAIGLALLIVVCLGIRGIDVSGFHERKTAGWRGGPSGDFIKYAAPTWQCAIAAVAGECLGLIGLAVGKWRRESISIVCVLGTAVCLLQMILFAVHLRYFT